MSITWEGQNSAKAVINIPRSNLVYFLFMCFHFKIVCMRSQGYCTTGDRIMYSDDDLPEVPYP